MSATNTDDQEMTPDTETAPTQEMAATKEGDTKDEKDQGKVSDLDESDTEANPNEEETEELCILDPEALDVDLNHGKIAKIENLEALTSVETLCLRWNLIKKIENLSTLTTLRELELYDNQVLLIL
jgi:hypothetical protein